MPPIARFFFALRLPTLYTMLISRTVTKCLGLLLFCLPLELAAQRFLSDYDSTLFIRDTVLSTVRRFERLHISGYMQPQYQIAQAKGIDSYEGGNFSSRTSNRFMIRRARVKIDYILPPKEGNVPKALFTFQFEATERDLNIRDMFVRIYEPKQQSLSLTTGLFARPFGFEVNLSSAFRETPERGRMSQILMPSERDLGAMVSWERQKPLFKNIRLKWDVGFFNGQGKSGPAEFDNFKDLISRLYLKPFRLSKGLFLSAGLSLLDGGWEQVSPYRFTTGVQNGSYLFKVDSSISNIGRKAPRRYQGADVQLEWRHGWGQTEWRAEYWRGTQPGTATSTNNPGTLPDGPVYIRQFDGGFFYFLQSLFNKDWELVVKYDWYDPNRLVAAAQIGKADTNFTPADIRYTTLGVGLSRYFSEYLKFLAYHSFVRNEGTLLNGYTDDLADDVFTFRVQFRF